MESPLIPDKDLLDPDAELSFEDEDGSGKNEGDLSPSHPLASPGLPAVPCLNFHFSLFTGYYVQ